MRLKETITLILASLIVLGTTSTVYASDADKHSCTKLQNEWMKLYKLPFTAKRSSEKHNLRKTMERLYRERQKDPQANFIESATESELADAISRITIGKLTDFPSIVERKNRYVVAKQKSGTLTFSPITGCVGDFSIPKSSKHYPAALQHVGTLQVGELKKVPEVPFRELLRDDELVVIPDPDNN